MRTVIVIGNGFDIDLGWRTSYKDFCDSMKHKWKIIGTSEDRLYNYVIHHVGDNWYDLELTIYNYCKCKSEIYNSIAAEYLIDNDLNDFNDLKRELTHFLGSRSKEAINKDSYASLLLKKYIGQINRPGLPIEDKPILFSFNYTPLKKVANEIAPNSPFSYYAMHGTLEEDNCILGFQEDDVIKGKYRKLQKSRDSKFSPPSIYASSLMNADRMIFFGLSMGFIDAIYFKDFFEKMSKSLEVYKAPQVQIVTWDENSVDEIIENLHKYYGLNYQSLKVSRDIRFLLTKEGFPLDSIEM